jgi:hypothetical protein
MTRPLANLLSLATRFESQKFCNRTRRAPRARPPAPPLVQGYRRYAARNMSKTKINEPDGVGRAPFQFTQRAVLFEQL